MNDFKPFGSVMTKVKNRTIDPSYEIHLGLYQALTGPDEEDKIYKSVSCDFFDLIVIDECHFGTSHETQVSKKLQEWFGLPDPSQLVERNIKILQTSATPDNVILSATRWTELIGQMHHTHITPTTISPSYTGVHTFFEQDRIFESVDLTDYSALAQIKTKIDQYDTPKYHIFRISPKIQKQIETVNNLEHFRD